MQKAKTSWLKHRLKEIDRTSAQLARYLGAREPSVHEIASGRRRIQLHELVPMATFLQWGLFELLRHLPKHERLALIEPFAAIMKAMIDEQVERLRED